MHNEYVTNCCILNKKDKLLLLKYSDTDITMISELLAQIVLNLLDQCYMHVEKFHELNKLKNKKYKGLEPLIVEQLKDMLFTKKKFIEFFSKPGKKTKEDLFTYIFASQISANYFNEYLYRVIIRYLKGGFTSNFWNKYNLSEFELNTLGLPDFYVLRDKKEECSTGKVNIDLNSSVEIIDRFLTRKSTKEDTVENKLNTIKLLAVVLDNYYNKDLMILHEPYRDSATELIDNIKVSMSLEKPKQLMKRL